jgi:hypothetical protein
MDTHTAMLVIISIVGMEILKRVVDYFFKRATRDDFITKADCAQCKKTIGDFITRADCAKCEKAGDDITTKLASEIAIIKGILLVIAVKSGIPPEQLSKLTN